MMLLAMGAALKIGHAVRFTWKNVWRTDRFSSMCKAENCTEDESLDVERRSFLAGATASFSPEAKSRPMAP